jgi:hypothetical protein
VTSTVEKGPNTARLSVNLTHDTMATLRWIADRRGASVTETVRRAIAVLKFVEDEVDKGNKLAIVETSADNTQHVREILLVG